MKVEYFADTDTLYIEFRKPQRETETRDLDENTLIDLDPDGRVTGITVEHASEQTRRFEAVASRTHGGLEVHDCRRYKQLIAGQSKWCRRGDLNPHELIAH